MKLIPWLIILILLQTGIMLFDNVYTTNDYFLNPYNQSENYAESSALWDFIVDPSIGTASSFFSTNLYALLIGGAGTLVVIGLYVFTKTETVLLSPLAALFAVFGLFPIINLYTIVNRETSYYACSGIPGVCTAGVLISVMAVSPFIIIHILSIIEFWTGRPQ